LGEHQDTLRHSTNWQRFALFNHDTVPDKGRNLYGSHPFYLVMENDGLSHGVFLKNSDPMEVILQPTPAITFRALGGIIDLYFLLGPTPQEVGFFKLSNSYCVLLVCCLSCPSGYSTIYRCYWSPSNAALLGFGISSLSLQLWLNESYS
jgi:hypothetical protein